MNCDEDFEFMKRAEESPIMGSKQSAIEVNNGRRIEVKDSKRGYVIGEINYIEKNRNFYYSKRDDGERVKLFYSNLERIFINNKKN